MKNLKRKSVFGMAELLKTSSLFKSKRLPERTGLKLVCYWARTELEPEQDWTRTGLNLGQR